MTPVPSSQHVPRRTVFQATAISAAVVILLFFICCIHTAKNDSVTWDESLHPLFRMAFLGSTQTLVTTSKFLRW